jgi:hypothetical protein
MQTQRIASIHKAAVVGFLSLQANKLQAAHSNFYPNLSALRTDFFWYAQNFTDIYIYIYIYIYTKKNVPLMTQNNCQIAYRLMCRPMHVLAVLLSRHTTEIQTYIHTHLVKKYYKVFAKFSEKLDKITEANTETE